MRIQREKKINGHTLNLQRQRAGEEWRKSEIETNGKTKRDQK